MNLYHAGLSAGGIILPEQLTPLRQRFDDVSWGSSAIRSGEARFYGRGLAPSWVRTGGEGFTGEVTGFLGLIFDTVHVLLLVVGGFVLWRAITL